MLCVYPLPHDAESVIEKKTLFSCHQLKHFRIYLDSDTIVEVTTMLHYPEVWFLQGISTPTTLWAGDDGKLNYLVLF